MSRVGKLPVAVPSDVKVNIDDLSITVEGPKGVLSRTFKGPIAIEFMQNAVSVRPTDESQHARAMWGTARSIINNMVHGVKNSFSITLNVDGVGYRSAVVGSFLNLTLGKSHGTKIFIPAGIKVETPKQNVVVLSSIDNELLGKFAATIIAQRKPEPYKGKGIKVHGQPVYRKEGKKK